MADSKTKNTTQEERESFVPRIGSEFGYLIVRQITKRQVRDGKGLYVICECQCGREVEVSSYGLQRKGRKAGYRSCGQCQGPRGPYKTVCSKGHDTTKWGRTPSGACKGCNKESSLQRNYGISLDDYEKLWSVQDGKCAVCGKSLGTLFGLELAGFSRSGRAEVDHKHGMKKIPKRETVRGLLCGGRWAGCNRKLGRIDNVDWLQKVLHYLQNPPAKLVLDKPAAK